MTRTERNGRFVYSVNGTEMRTSNKAYAYATTGTGNPHRAGQHGEPDDGYYLTLHMTAAAAAKAAAKFPGMRDVAIERAGKVMERNDDYAAEARADDRWQQAYNNATERLFGKVAGDTLDDEQDAAAIEEANAEIAAEGPAS